MAILYYNSDNRLHFERIDLTAFSNKVKTPYYIYSTAEISNNCDKIYSVSSNTDFMPCYALKANYNPYLIKLICNKGFGADVVSGGELYFAQKCGIPSNKIVFAGVGKTEVEIEQAIIAGIHSLNVESESELKKICEVAQRLGKKVRIAIRVNPDIDPQTHPYISTGLHSNKFGVPKEFAVRLFKLAKEHQNIEPEGIHVHIGSQIQTDEPYIQTAHFLKALYFELKTAGIEIKYLDLGGGIGINYENQLDQQNESRVYIENILPKFLKPLKELNLKILIELGRSIVGSAGLLITKVIYIKNSPSKKFIIVDAAMNNLIRPSLYQAFHQILPLVKNNKISEKVDVVGPVCETSDFFAKDRELPELKEGDYLAISGAGAYGQVLCSNYNLRPTIAEYLVDGENVSTIYKGESIESIAAKYSW